MNKAKLEPMAVSAFENVRETRAQLFTSAECAIEAQQALDMDKGAAMVSGKFDGKNAETREAQAREFLAGQYGAVEECGRKERLARFKFEVAQIDLETVKTLLCIAELAE